MSQKSDLGKAQRRVLAVAARLKMQPQVGLVYTYTDEIVCVGQYFRPSFKGEYRYEQATEWLNGLADKWEAEANAE